MKQEEKRAEGFSVRSALAQLKTILDYTSGAPLDIVTFGRFADSVRNEMRDQNSVIEQQLVTRNKLQQLNYELIIKRQKTRMYSMLVVVVFVGVLVSLTFYIRNRRKRLAEAEERIDALTRLLEDAQKVSDNQEENSGAFFKKLLLSSWVSYGLLPIAYLTEPGVAVNLFRASAIRRFRWKASCLGRPLSGN